MADGLDLHVDAEKAAKLDAEKAAKLKALADGLDMSPEEYAAFLIDREIDQAAQAPIDPDPAIDRAIIERMKRTGEGTPWPELRDRLRARRHR